MNPTLWNALTRTHTSLYRLTGGRLGGKVRGISILLLDHVGRKSGDERTTPLLYIQDGEDFVIVASNGGARKHPAWWLNLREQPRASIQVGGRKLTVQAKEATSRDKRRLWERLVEAWPDYEQYQRRTKRQIPVVRLTPA